MKPATLVRSKKGKALWISLALALILLSGWYSYRTLRASMLASTSQEQTEVARRGDLTVSASGTGTLVAQSKASFGFDASGRVTAVLVKVGDQVEAGQILAKMDDTLAQMEVDEAQQTLRELYSAASIATVQQEIATAKDTEFYAREWLEYLLSPEVLEAEENLAIAQQKLADAQAEANANPSDAANQVVKEKEQAVTYLTDKLTQAQTYYKETYLPEEFGEYENVGSRRFQKLVLVTYIDPVTGKEVPEINGPSTDDIAIARNNYIQAQETVRKGELYLEALNTGVIPEDGTGEKLTTLYQAQLALENAQAELDATQLVAPISGTVTSLDLNVGEQAGTDSVITISQLSQPYTVDAYLDEADWETASVGNKVNVTFELLPEQTYAGTVTLVYPELSESFEASLIHLVVQLDSSISQELPAGTGATIGVVGGEAQGVVLVSVNAIHKGEDGKSYVTVMQNRQQMEREVLVGLQNDTYAEVKSGLDAGEIVVTE
ncbi:MAG TPA: HlyD family efflux transporter periplasmic adaptor subunit [Anaerolineales bacterium]|nr:HlyD family efflux transporter periplasmic adaptor subunit [Anaerolineales bacterium]